MSKIVKTPHGVIEFMDELDYLDAKKYLEQWLRENDHYRYYFETPELYKGVFICYRKSSYNIQYVLLAVGRLGMYEINANDPVECWYLRRFTSDYEGVHNEMIDICHKTIDQLRGE